MPYVSNLMRDAQPRESSEQERANHMLRNMVGKMQRVDCVYLYDGVDVCCALSREEESSEVAEMAEMAELAELCDDEA